MLSHEAEASRTAGGQRPPDRGAPLVERIVTWSVEHRARAIGGWLLLVAFALVLSAFVPGDDALSHDPGDTGVAQQVLRDQPSYEPSLENVLVQSHQGGTAPFATNPELRATTEDLVRSLTALPGAVTGLRSPMDTPGQVSRDGGSGLVTYFVAGPNDQMSEHHAAAVETIEAVAARHPGVRVAEAGDRSLNSAVDDAVQDDFTRAELISLPLTAVILLVVFGSLIAASIPLLLAGTTMIAAFSLVAIVGKVIPVNSAVSSMILLIGVAVSIDYALFYLRREREERLAGRDVGRALRIAARTSGRVVIVSGLTVMFCVAGLLFTGLDNFRGLTVGAVLVVALAVLGSVTVLPAVLALLGHRVEKARVPWLGKRRTAAHESRIWTAISRAVVHRPLLWTVLSLLALAVMAVPALDIHLQDAGPTNSLPRRVPTVDNAVRMQQAFPGAAAPAKVVVWGDADDAALDQQVERVRAQITARPDLFAEPLSTIRVDGSLILRVPLAGEGTDPLSNRALLALRQEVLPQTIGTVQGAEYAVSGRTAFAYDFTERVRDTLPIVFGFVLTLAFILLAVAFRSLAIPVVSILLNLVSIGAAYGVLTWVFQDGHGASLLGFTPYGGVVGWMPLFIFVLLFGLSMDYHIFILSRIRERWATGVPARTAIVEGVGRSAGVITSAAAIMIAVFSVFVVLSAIEYKMLGVGMAVAILIDATLVRGVLLPAAMALLGDKAWSLPGRPPPRRFADHRAPAPGPATTAEEPLVTRLGQRF